MKIVVNQLPEKAEDCLFCYNSHYYKNNKPQCFLKQGAVCRMWADKYGNPCPYLVAKSEQRLNE